MKINSIEREWNWEDTNWLDKLMQRFYRWFFVDESIVSHVSVIFLIKMRENITQIGDRIYLFHKYKIIITCLND